MADVIRLKDGNVHADQGTSGQRMPPSLQSVSLAILAFLMGTFALKYAGVICIPIAFSILLSYALDPIVTALARWRIPRFLTAAILLLLIVGGLGWMAYSLRHDMATALERIPAAAKKFRQILQGDQEGPEAFEKIKKAVGELEKTAAQATQSEKPSAGNARHVEIAEQPLKLTDYLLWGSLSAMTASSEALIVLFLVYFILTAGDLFKQKLIKIVGPVRSKKRLAIEILEDINSEIRWFLLALVLTSIIVAVSSWLAFRWVGLEQAAIWGIAAGVLNTIPYVGPALVAGGVGVIGFLQFGSLSDVGLLVGLALLITSLEGYLLTPWLMGQAGKMNAVAVFVGLLFWGWVWGAWGLVLAVPMLMVTKVVCDHIDELKFIGELLGE